jgi:hypothetical protein
VGLLIPSSANAGLAVVGQRRLALVIAQPGEVCELVEVGHAALAQRPTKRVIAPAHGQSNKYQALSSLGLCSDSGSHFGYAAG